MSPTYLNPPLVCLPVHVYTYRPCITPSSRSRPAGCEYRARGRSCLYSFNPKRPEKTKRRRSAQCIRGKGNRRRAVDAANNGFRSATTAERPASCFVYYKYVYTSTRTTFDPARIIRRRPCRNVNTRRASYDYSLVPGRAGQNVWCPNSPAAANKKPRRRRRGPRRPCHRQCGGAVYPGLPGKH